MKENNRENEDLSQQITMLKNEIEKLKASAIIPVGAVQAFAIENAPDGWLICDGTEYSITEDRRELFNVIGNIFGGDGVTSFCVPDLRGQFIRGWDMDGNIDPERELGDFQDDALQGHGHDVKMSAFEIEENGEHNHSTSYASWTAGTWGSDTSIYEVRPSSYSSAKYTDGSGTSSDGKHTHKIKLKSNLITDVIPSKYGLIKCDVETRPKNVALLYCIKY